jgi:hypothetical protein
MSAVATAIIGSAVIGGAVAANGQKQQGEIAGRQMDMAAQAQADANAISQQQVNLATRQQDIADDYNTYNKTVYRPLETGLVSDAEKAGSQSEQETAAGKAGAAVQHSLTQQRDATGRTLARMGISANSGRALAVNANLDANAALGTAAAENTARDTAKQLGWAKRMDAASIGRNLSSAQATSASIASQGLTGAAGTALGGARLGLSANDSLMANSIASTNSNMAGVGSVAGMAMRYGTSSPTGPGYTSRMTPLQSVNNSFTTTNAPWSESAAYDNPSGQ